MRGGFVEQVEATMRAAKSAFRTTFGVELEF